MPCGEAGDSRKSKGHHEKGLIFMDAREELTEEERELEMICKEIEWNSKRIMSDRSKKRIKGLYYNKGLPIPSLRTLVDMGSALGMLGIDFLVATGETWAKAILETRTQNRPEASSSETADDKQTT